uniref:ARAE3 n=1 Tax=Arundo donax TaxID=35708 RepID=A0A0A9GQJ9_ARUDO
MARKHTIATKARRLLQNKYTECCEDQGHNDFPNIMRLPPCIEVLHPSPRQACPPV